MSPAPGVSAFSVRDYYKHFVSVFGIVTTAISALPLVAELFPTDYTRHLFPPLGPEQNAFSLMAFVLAVLVTLIVYFTKDMMFAASKRGRIRALSSFLAVAICGVTAYMVLNAQLVRSLPVPAQDRQIVVSIGYDRTPYAKERFAELSDWQLLRERGATEEEIRRLWTAPSIVISRVGLFLSYLLFLLSAVAIGSLAVLFDKSGPPLSA